MFDHPGRRNGGQGPFQLNTNNISWPLGLSVAKHAVVGKRTQCGNAWLYSRWKVHLMQ